MPSGDLTGLLRKWSQGDEADVDELTPLLYSELRRLAHRYLRRERADRSAELVHEAYLRLIDQKQASWQNRAHFFAVSGQIMRRILVDYARWRHAEKRGGGAATLVLNDAIDMPDSWQDRDVRALRRAGKTWTQVEQEAAANATRLLTQDDRAPQTVYRVAVKPGEPLMVKVRLRYSPGKRDAR